MSEPTYAGAWRRFMGIVYEWVILFGVVFFFGYAFSALTQFKGAPGYGRLGLQLWMFLVLGAYFTYFWSRGRRSLPMKTLNLALVSRDHKPLSLTHAFVRYCVTALLLLLPLALAKTVHPALALLAGATLLTTPFDRQRRALHDMLCGTLLVITPDLPRASPGAGRPSRSAQAQPDAAADQSARTQSTK